MLIKWYNMHKYIIIANRFARLISNKPILPGKAGCVGGGLLSACLSTTTSPSFTP